jgi:hypothetical protein
MEQKVAKGTKKEAVTPRMEVPAGQEFASSDCGIALGPLISGLLCGNAPVHLVIETRI